MEFPARTASAPDAPQRAARSPGARPPDRKATLAPDRTASSFAAFLVIFLGRCRENRRFRARNRRRTTCQVSKVNNISSEELGQLPPYCGLVRSEELEVLIIGVAHFDGGISGQSARKMIQDFRPKLCLVELDQQRFSRLLASRRGLPWPYLPLRGAKYQPSPVVQKMREVLFSGLELAQNIVGNKETGGGDEFYEAFLAAESQGAIVVPGDLQITNALDSLVQAIRQGFTQPFQHIAAGSTAFFRALGGFIRPAYGGHAANATGIAMPMALLADGGWRALPLARATAVGFVVVNALSFLIGGNGMETNIEGLQRMDLQGLADVAIALFGLVVALIMGSSYMLSFLESRDLHMAARLLQVADLMENQKVSGLVHCRWLKSSWAATAAEPKPDGTQVLPPEVLAQAEQAEQLEQALRVPRPPPDEVRNFSLFEPRFLRLFDQLKDAEIKGGVADDEDVKGEESEGEESEMEDVEDEGRLGDWLEAAVFKHPKFKQMSFDFDDLGQSLQRLEKHCDDIEQQLQEKKAEIEQKDRMIAHLSAQVAQLQGAK
ncbi:unnamed protein product [Durusdinium trenchii]|uniref:Uncharacterized protein n=1 Tax=Durusdinium trenchii TaxID=1381693 RepID=A0ABP0QVV3_9DINO